MLPILDRGLVVSERGVRFGSLVGCGKSYDVCVVYE